MLQNPDYEEAKPFLDEGQDQVEAPDPKCQCRRSRIRKHTSQVLPWILTAISWLFTAYLLFSNQSASHITTQPIHPNNTMTSNNQIILDRSFSTDFSALRPSVHYETRTFTGALLYNETSKRFYRNISTSDPAYVGPPTSAIDAAWEDLLHNEWTAMTDDEAAPFLPELKTFNAAYQFEPDMFHSLHCLNEVRKRIDLDYYSAPEHAGIHIDQEDWDRIHIDHCLDQLRQTITCFGDLSPVPLYSWEGAPLGIGRGTAHTCRKWEPIREYIDSRHAE